MEEKKELPKIKTFNNEELTRKEIQKRWDKYLIASFFEYKDYKMYYKRLRFYEENGITEELLKENNFTIHRMPEVYSHDRMSTRVFVCNCIPKLGEILFNYDSKSYVEKLDFLQKKIVELKLRTIVKNGKDLNREEKEEFRKTDEDFKKYNNKKALLGMEKEENNAYNWKKIK